MSGRTSGRRRPRVVRHLVTGLLVVAYLLGAAVVAIVHTTGRDLTWLALHLLVLGAATNAVFVWSRHFAQALLHARPGSERPALARLAVLNVGVAAVLGGVTGGLPVLAEAGAAIVVSAVIAHAASMLIMLRSSPLAGPLAGVAWYYVAAGAAMAVGGTIGGVLAAGVVRSASWSTALVLTHAQLNLLGWLGLTIIGTQFMLWPMILRTRLSDAAARRLRPVLALTAGGLTAAASGSLASAVSADGHWLAAAGMAAYLAGALASFGPAAEEMRGKPPRTAAAWALLAGNAWLVVALAADTAALAAGLTTADEVLVRLLIPVLGVGAVGQILIGALTFLLPVTVGGGPAGNRRLAATLELAWRTRAILGNLGVLAVVALPAGGWPAAAAWSATLAGFASFPVLAVAALAGGRRRA